MKRMMIALMLVMALATGIVAQAEETTTESTMPVEEAAAPAEEATGDNAEETLMDALKALHEARLSDKLDELQTELDGYVAGGKLTQEQADLIMDSIRERQAAQNGECPNCGYKFQNKGPKMGPQGGRMPGMGRMNGNGPQMPNGGQMPQGGQQMPQGQFPGNGQRGNQMPGMQGQFPGQR